MGTGGRQECCNLIFFLQLYLTLPHPSLAASLQLYLTGDSDLTGGSSSTGYISAPDVGKLSSMVLRLCETYNGPPNSQLYISRVEVLHVPSGNMTAFPLDAWISKDDTTTLTAQGTQDVFVNYEVRPLSCSGPILRANNGIPPYLLQPP